MHLKSFVFILCLMIILTACNLPQAATNTPLPPTATNTPAPPTATNTPIPPTLTPTPSMPVLLDITFGESNPEPSVYTLNAIYPRLDPASVAQTLPFDLEIQDLVMGIVDGMRTDFIANAATLPPELAGPGGSFLDVTYDVEYLSPAIISLRFEFHYYVAGSVHPNMFYHSYTYDLAAGRALALADLFQPGSNYLQAVSDQCVAQLTARLGADGWMGGAGPDLANFKAWNLTPGGLLVTFDPYQVAAYALGPQEVLVPYSVLSAIYLPQYLP